METIETHPGYWCDVCSANSILGKILVTSFINNDGYIARVKSTKGGMNFDVRTPSLLLHPSVKFNNGLVCIAGKPEVGTDLFVSIGTIVRSFGPCAGKPLVTVGSGPNSFIVYVPRDAYNYDMLFVDVYSSINKFGDGRIEDGSAAAGGLVAIDEVTGLPITSTKQNIHVLPNGKIVHMVQWNEDRTICAGQSESGGIEYYIYPLNIYGKIFPGEICWFPRIAGTMDEFLLASAIKNPDGSSCVKTVYCNPPFTNYIEPIETLPELTSNTNINPVITPEVIPEPPKIEPSIVIETPPAKPPEVPKPIPRIEDTLFELIKKIFALFKKRK